ncbi:hypothetical protein [Paenibacillus lemnae]|uniref:Uncharacterized protein n=1 Tax=Paenibacillus lemnae TaxID=1330551 RepID=A0A848M3R6_PAELE|nr:hypothetical protein [Paenibacillus lemnae]NMO95236.1 hypothetical protein [Paenibacillus lemnae]
MKAARSAGGTNRVKRARQKAAAAMPKGRSARRGQEGRRKAAAARALLARRRGRQGLKRSVPRGPGGQNIGSLFFTPTYSKGYTQAYEEGFNSGFAKGYEDGLTV